MADHSHGHPDNPIKYYIGVFGLLLVMTILTVFVARFDLAEKFKDVWLLGHISGNLNALVALTIAVIKATAVAVIFIHLRWRSRLTQGIVVSGGVLRFFIVL